MGSKSLIFYDDLIAEINPLELSLISKLSYGEFITMELFLLVGEHLIVLVGYLSKIYLSWF